MATDLNALKKSTQHPPIITLHGHEGIGKSTVANGFPNAMWLNLEDTTYDFDPYFPVTPETYTDVIGILDGLLEQDNEYKTLIIDTMDKLEILMTEHICAENGWSSISDPAYGKGYSARSAEFQTNFWKKIRDLNRKKHMVIILIAHSKIEKVQDPILPEYDKHTLQLYKTENAFIRRESDLVGYCMIEAFTTSDGKRNMATTAGEHQIRTRPNPAYDAKTRKINMPEILKMEAKAILNCYRTQKQVKE